MTQPYGREDIDYRTEGDPSSGYVFNAAESVFFRRIRNLMYSQLAAMYLSRETANAWSATGLINEFDNWQNQFCEELWRLDTERKYYRTYYGGTKRFLETMMNGRKRYHRRQWERDQEAYMGTKYVSANVKRDQIMFRCNTPIGAVVTPNYDLSIVPYSDMYLSVLYGNSLAPIQIRAKAGQTYTIRTPDGFTTMDDTAILIYCASRIQALNDLSGCYIHDNDFSKASKLQKLTIGNTTEGYSNTFMTELNIGNNPLLQELNVRNCPNLVGSVNLTNCGNLEKFYAEGTAITGVTFAPNGKIVSAYLPGTVNTLSMKNLKYLTDLQVTYDNLESLTEEDSIVNERVIVEDAIDTLQTLRLTGIDWTMPDDSLLESILAMNSSVLAGKVHIGGAIGQQDLANYNRAWPDLAITYDSLITQYKITYVNADTNNTVLYEMYVDRGEVPIDPYEAGLIPKPTLPSDAQYEYAFSGWENLTDQALHSRTVTAQYTKTVRTYTVTWYERAGLALTSVTAEYGSEVVYPGAIPTNESEEAQYVYNIFAGWNKSTGFITGDTDVYAIWQRAELPAAGTDLKDMTPAQIFAVTKSGRTANYFVLKDYFDMNLGHDFDFENVESEVLAENLYLDGNTAIDKQITLFGENDRSFTMAIDFQYSETTKNGTLVSCFEEEGAEGFRLRFNSNPDIQWGDVSAKFGSGKYRDMVVIRHRKGENKLYVYASNGTNSRENFSTAIVRNELVRSRSTNTPSILTFGAIRFIEDGGYDDYGRGHIHWCKIWYEDLGDTNARQLAAWPHEPLRMEYYGTGLYRITGGGSQKSNASFICNHLLAGRGHQMNTSGTNAGGWEASLMRTKLMVRLRDAMPTVWQSMMKQVRVGASAGSQSTEILLSDDYVYLPCTTEMNGHGSAPYANEGSHIGWYTGNQRRVKFRGYKIPDGASYYSVGSDPAANSANNVKFGDVWMHTGDQGIGRTFVDADYLSKYGITPSESAANGGGWIKDTVWWLRSPYATGSTSFWYVNGNGNMGNRSADASLGVCPCFSI